MIILGKSGERKTRKGQNQIKTGQKREACGHPVNGPYCQGCTLLREKLEEDLVTYFQDFQNAFESSDDSTNVFNAPREPFVVKQDHEIFINKIIHSFSSNQRHCFHCKDVLRDGEACQRCTCTRCGSGLSKGLCYICGNNQNSSNDSLSIYANSSQNPPQIDECCCECGNALNGIFCQQCTCLSCGALYTGDFCCSKGNVEDEILVPKPPKNCARCAKCGHRVNGPYCQGCALLREKLEEDLKIPACCDDDDNYDSAITPVLSTEEPDNSLSMGDEHLDTILATESDEVIKSSVENLVPIPSEFEGIPDTMCDEHIVNNPTPLKAKDHFEIVTKSNDDISFSDDDSLYNENIEYVEASPHDSEVVSLEVAEIVIPEEEEIKDDNLREKLLNVHLLIANIEALKENPTPSSKSLTKSSSTSPKSFLEETNTFYNSLPEFDNFYFDLEEISSDSTTTHSDISLPDYEAFSFNNDHIKEISSGSTTTHSDISLSEYDSFIFDFTHEEFVDKLSHIISPPEYDCFYFWDLLDPGELMSILNFGIRENLSTTSVNLPIEDDHSPLLAYVVWIFLAYLTYPVIPPYLHPFGNEDTIFDRGITINRVYSFKPGLSHRCGAFKKFKYSP
nr:hypothetical protein [Tanacetum cinerariifolium]